MSGPDPTAAIDGGIAGPVSVSPSPRESRMCVNCPRVGADKPAAVNRRLREKGHAASPQPSRCLLREHASSEQG